jgi:heme oxygenase
MKIEISNDTVTRIMTDVLIEDYKYLEQDIKRYQEKGFLSPVETEDLNSWIKYRDAFNILLEYYIGENWRSKV